MDVAVEVLSVEEEEDGVRWGLLWRPTWRPSMKAIVRMMRTFRTESRERQRLERPILMMMGRRGKRG